MAQAFFSSQHFYLLTVPQTSLYSHNFYPLTELSASHKTPKRSFPSQHFYPPPVPSTSLSSQYNHTRASKASLPHIASAHQECYKLPSLSQYICSTRDMREANWKNSDRYFHARGNKDAASRGPGGRWAAEVIRLVSDRSPRHSLVCVCVCVCQEWVVSWFLMSPQQRQGGRRSSDRR